MTCEWGISSVCIAYTTTLEISESKQCLRVWFQSHGCTGWVFEDNCSYKIVFSASIFSILALCLLISSLIIWVLLWNIKIEVTLQVFESLRLIVYAHKFMCLNSLSAWKDCFVHKMYWNSWVLFPCVSRRYWLVVLFCSMEITSRNVWCRTEMWNSWWKPPNMAGEWQLSINYIFLKKMTTTVLFIPQSENVSGQHV